MSATVLDVTQSPSNQPNILDNGGFEIWQRGTSFSNPANGSYTVDRWQTYKPVTTPATADISRVTSPVDSGQYAADINITATGSGAYQYIFQPVENYQFYAGKTVTVSVRVNTTVSNVVVSIQDTNGQTNSANHPADGQYHTLTVTKTLSNSTTFFDVLVGCTSVVGTGHIYIDSAMLVLGAGIPTFMALHPAIDLARCQRYYEIGGGSNEVRTHTMTRDASHNYFFYYGQFSVTKRVNPTMTMTPNQFILVQNAALGTSALGADQSNWSMVNDGIDTKVFNFQGVRNAPNSTFDSIDVQATWTASADL